MFRWWCSYDENSVSLWLNIMCRWVMEVDCKERIQKVCDTSVLLFVIFIRIIDCIRESLTCLTCWCGSDTLILIINLKSDFF